MKLYYKDKLKAIVEERYDQARRDAMCGLIAHLPPIIKFRNDVVRQLFVAEPDEVREEVVRYVTKRKLGRDFDSDDDDDDEAKATCQTVNAQAEAFLK